MSYEYLPRIFNIDYVSFPLDKEAGINFMNLEKSIKEKNVRMIFISSPGNPYGKT